MAQAISWLTRCQNTDGGWGESPGRSSDVFPSYLAIWALTQCGLGRTTWASRGLRRFTRNRTSMGGWGAEFSDVPTIDPTARGLLSVFRLRRLGKRFILTGADRQAVAFVLAAQSRDGAWPRDLAGQYRGARSGVQVSREADVGATLPFIDLLAMIPEERRGPEMDSALQGAMVWVKSLVNNDGGCGHSRGEPSNALATAWALRALSLAYRDEYRGVRERLVGYLLRAQNASFWRSDDESRSSLLCTYNAVHSLIRNGGSLSDAPISLAVKWLLSQQREDGSWEVNADSQSTQFTASLVLVLSQVITADPTSNCQLAVLAPLVESLNQVERQRSVQEVSQRFGLYASRNVLIIAVCLMLLSLGGFSFEVWTRLSPGTRSVLLVGVALAIAVNVAAAFIYDRWLRRR